ncbi:carboxypeptidase-like regulatory domain-containing protein [Flavobacterium sp. N502536]|uniref:Kelch repeat-containing protein n=1 Tax=Flavobacterium sp. N502536 TaxID=2986837 RepID=UPI002222F19E|nr:carboxypeptidase-like regulatory domain-containing protein [Flavobacterium sp. N502536]
MKKLLLLFILSPLLSIAQNINGTIISQETKLPIANTNVFALSSKTGTITDEEGKFSLNLLSKFKDNEVLEFSHIGYASVQFSLSYLKKQNYKVFLEDEVQNLSGVTVKANPKLNLKLPYSKLTSMKHSIFSFGSFLKDDKIYIIGGDASYEVDRLELIRSKRADFTLTTYLEAYQQNAVLSYFRRDFSIYDIKTNTWEYPKLEPKLKKRAHHNIHYYNNSIYVLGGKSLKVNQKSNWEYLQNENEVLDLNNQTIKTDYTTPHQAADFASFTYKDNIIVMGGSLKLSESGKKDFTNKVHLYNITSGYWYELDPMPTAKETSGIVIDDTIYLIGGDDGKPVSKIETFDLNTQAWQTEGDLFYGLEKPAIAYHDNIIYIYEDRTMYTYDLKTKQLKEYETELALKYSTMYFADNKLYILGGRTESKFEKAPSSTIFTFDLEDFKNTKPARTKTLKREMNLAKAN